MARVAVRTHAGHVHVWYWCPGCKHLHSVPADRWNWNGDVERPTLSPSVLHYLTLPITDERRTVCHYFIRDGRIEFCRDSPHALGGQIVDLVELTDAHGVPSDS